MADVFAKCTKQEYTPKSINCEIKLDKNEMWKAFVDGSSNFKGTRIGVVIMNKKTIHEYSLQITFIVINNVLEYKGVIFQVIIANKFDA